MKTVAEAHETLMACVEPWLTKAPDGWVLMVTFDRLLRDLEEAARVEVLVRQANLRKEEAA